ncbi:GNAT family N-acetyltransferase [Pseudonocardia aurantiaca]|uniref:GNAT family N-acetyltransferase n=1 Tax=Pseudonocardia aurantiaca TaxID=75290 RepID=A0ABW4FC89_9PSEU
MLVRPARPQEAPALAALAVRSKAHWGYSREFIERFAAGMGLTSEVVATNDVQVGERDGEPRGFYTLLHRGRLVVLDDLWLEPAEIGHGSGRLLFEHAAARALRSGAAVLEWEAEPYAVGFYTRMGGDTVRWTGSALGRRLPVMRLQLT